MKRFDFHIDILRQNWKDDDIVPAIIEVVDKTYVPAGMTVVADIGKIKTVRIRVGDLHLYEDDEKILRISLSRPITTV